MIVERCNEVVSRAAKLGPEASIDVDQLALRVTLDVIGLVSTCCIGDHCMCCIRQHDPVGEANLM